MADEQRNDDTEATEANGAIEGIVLRGNAMRWVWVLIGSVAIATLGAALALAAGTGIVANVVGVVTVVIFLFCAVVALRQVLNPGLLVIGGGAIQVVRRGRTSTFALHECGRFTTWRNPSRGTVTVVFDYAPDGDTAINRANRQMMGGSRMLSDNYGMAAETLADLLNDARRSASTEDLGGFGSPP